MRVTGSSFRGEVHERVAYKYADGFPQIHKYGAWLVRRVADPEASLREHTGPAPTHVIRDLAEVPDLVR